MFDPLSIKLYADFVRSIRRGQNHPAVITASGMREMVSRLSALNFSSRPELRNPGFFASSVSGRLGAGGETLLPPGLASTVEGTGRANEKCPSPSVIVAKRLSGEYTSARPIASCVMLLTTVP
jgi:hypothetical protein